MDFLRLGKYIIDSVNNAIEHIKIQDYWDDIIFLFIYR
ncbi:hypothetical protein XBKQ1_1880002 [Xenorhabdus bovienii str. kraussei Quebec]|uniref:Uncharacterized protein n=1 Tax=Xenorhabdus bovienii str. kraussei Quebec TaxID=1398203 RepID=A0A077PHF8_XENBV|nr:hypothetical protein XBKQ1_1880002 [Xenorhabdus bovienii str. kraussei Quebec]